MVLTAKQQRFVEEYLVDLNATQAAIRSGYSLKTAGSIGQENLKKPEIAAAIAEGQAKLIEHTQITAEMVVNELAKIGFANAADYLQAGPDGYPSFDFRALTRDNGAALSHVAVEFFKDDRGRDTRDVRRVTFRLADKHAALVALGRHLGMFRTDGKVASGEEAQDVQEIVARALSATDGILERVLAELAPQGIS